MRPITVEICAFGSYKGKQIIDFRMATQNIFLISGNTGSGKSTIFDSIVYALYGEVSSSAKDKSGLMLVSQFADKNVSPYVELTFENNGETYVVRREPRHHTYNKSGKQNATDANEKVTLRMPDGNDYPSKEANKKILEIVGLTKEQFMQIAMIAQGEFVDVLVAKSDKKRETFRKLFGTEIYAKMIEESKNRVTSKNSEIKSLMAKCAVHVESIDVSPEYEEYSTMKSHLDEFKKTSADKVNTALISEIADELDRYCESLATELKAASAESSSRQKIFEDLLKEKSAADELIGQFAALEEALKELEECKAKANLIEEKRKLVTDIRRSYEVKNVHDNYTKAVDILQIEKNNFKTNEDSLPELKSELDKLSAAFDEAKAKADVSSNEYAVISERVEKAVKSLKAIELLNKEIENLERQIAAKEKEEIVASNEKISFETELDNWKKRAQELDGADVKLANEENKSKEIGAARKSWNELRKNQVEASSSSDKFIKAQDKVEADNKAYLQKETEYNEAITNFLRNQAGLLAKNLVDGKECPVCGNTVHPNPCVVDENIRILSDEELDVLKKEADDLRETSIASGKYASNLKTSLDALTDTIEKSRVELVGLLSSLKADVVEDADIDTLGAVLDRLESAQKDIVSKAMADSKELGSLVANINSADAKRNAIQGRLDAVKNEKQNLLSALTGKKSELETTNKDISYASVEEANKTLADAKKTMDSDMQSYKSSESQKAAAKTKVDSCEANIADGKKRIPELEKAATESEAMYNKALSDNDIDGEFWKSVVATNAKDTTALEKEIRLFDDRKNSAETKKDMATKAIQNREKPEVGDLSKRLNDAEEAKDNALGLETAIKGKADRHNSTLSSLKKIIDESSKLISEYSTIRNLYDTLSGQISGARMDIETFAQRQYLEQILDSANNHFRKMTAGQFELRICDISKAGSGKNRGLDLMVYSLVTGKENEISTLSGGESFMAALAVALGMADEIQAKSSAVELDIMFIDEGFGSLDERARNQAVSILKDMAGGSKLIGLISHVTEIKQHIDDKLLITKDSDGSHAKWER